MKSEKRRKFMKMVGISAVGAFILSNIPFAKNLTSNKVDITKVKVKIHTQAVKREKGI